MMENAKCMINKNRKEVWRMLINEWKIIVEGAGATKIEEGKHFPRLAPGIIAKNEFGSSFGLSIF